MCFWCWVNMCENNPSQLGNLSPCTCKSFKKISYFDPLRWFMSREIMICAFCCKESCKLWVFWVFFWAFCSFAAESLLQDHLKRRPHSEPCIVHPLEANCMWKRGAFQERLQKRTLQVDIYFHFRQVDKTTYWRYQVFFSLTFHLKLLLFHWNPKSLKVAHYNFIWTVYFEF